MAKLSEGSAWALQLRGRLAHLKPAARATEMLEYLGPHVAEVAMILGREETAECLFGLAETVIGEERIKR